MREHRSLHPRFWEEVHNLAQQVAKPFVLEHGGQLPQGTIGIDEQKNLSGVAASREQLDDLLQVLLRTDVRPARRYHDLRTLDEFKTLREQGMSEKKAVGEIGRRRAVSGSFSGQL